MTKAKCTICDDSGWEKIEKEGKEFLRRCKCQKIEVLKDRCLISNIPPRFAGSGLDDFYPEEGDRNLKKVIKDVKKFIDDYPAVQKGLLLHGGTGVGKTRLLCAIATGIIKKFSVSDIYYIDWNDMVREMRSGESHTFRDFSLINELINKLSETELLIMDELGSSIPSQWVRDNIYYLINHRYNKQKITLFATNYPDDSPDGELPTLKDRIGDRIRSRIFEMAESHYIKTLDYRQKWG